MGCGSDSSSPERRDDTANGPSAKRPRDELESASSPEASPELGEEARGRTAREKNGKPSPRSEGSQHERVVESVFKQAMVLAPSERQEFFDRLPGLEAQVRQDAESLLRHHDHSSGLLTPPSEVAEMRSLARDLREDLTDPAARIGQWLQRYQLVKVLGHGGMGVVYLAQQNEPVAREVAIKVIRLGLGSPEVKSRFEAERQVLALMNHPHIARVFDGGLAESGLPFFVMEYVPGQPITGYCRDQGLELEERLGLFLDVCAGVQHAHQKGIIHRDLKPANLLVYAEHGQHLLKIIDFGVAKVLHQGLAERSLATRPGQLVGTPAAMSPEQAQGTDAEVDTRTDIYSLGLVLYELLADRPPIDSKRASSASLGDLQKMICEEVPPPPSLHSSLRAGRRGMHRDLDWVVLRALEKDRERRYATVEELAADVRRAAVGDPVSVGPPSRWYRWRKLLAKHQVAAGLIGALLLSLVVGFGISMRFFLREQASHQEVLMLADAQRLEEAERAAKTLWPAHPEQVEAMEEWLAVIAEPLVGRLPAHRDRLSRLRKEAQPYTVEQRERDQREHPLARERKELERRRAALTMTDDFHRRRAREPAPVRDHVIAMQEQKIASVEAKLKEVGPRTRGRLSWHFEDAERQWQHDTLAALVTRLEVFAGEDPRVGTIAQVRARLEEARTLASRTLHDERVAEDWDFACFAIAEHPRYDGFELSPQLGLVPLGPDPDSDLWEFAVVQSGEVPSRLESGELLLSERSALVLVLLPGGTFSMGTPSDSHPTEYDGRLESPVHPVTLAPFFLSKFEMTQWQWQHLMGSNPSQHPPEEAFPGQPSSLWHPVESVSWEQALHACERLGLTLPTEAQWEYAARAGTTSNYWCGDSSSSLVGRANLGEGAADHWFLHAPVDEFPSNPFGLPGMHGNVREWCLDPLGSYLSPAEGPRGTRGAVFQGEPRVMRGGSYRSRADDARSARRHSVQDPDQRMPDSGLRPARGIDQP